MDSKPSVIFASCTSDSPSNIVKLLIGELPDSNEIEKGIECYPYHVNTKYYESDIQLCVMQSKIISSPGFANSVQGVVLYFDSEAPDCLKSVNDWLVILNEYQADIKILVCSRCHEKSDKGISKKEVQEWCIKEDFELVEIEPAEEEESDYEDDFPEAVGVKRISQALEAHVWPNLILKERKEPTTMAALLNGGIIQSADLNPFNIGEDNIEPSLEELSEQGNVEFCELFSQLASMKDRASDMPSDERKAYAEKIVLAYWNALGGDPEEMLDF